MNQDYNKVINRHIDLDDNDIETLRQKVSQITVPETVADDMREIIEGPLNRCGIYHRIFYRVKSEDSIVTKLTNVSKNYNAYHKMQDLIGLRIVLYYVDDIKICKDLIEREFPECEWAVSSQTTSEFKSMKTNGVMSLPKYIADRISPQTWELPIDKTFEVQIRTMAFEGWHEIEHDMRYKYTKMWEHDESRHYARKLNSVLATLELCDDSIISMLEEMGHTYYKEKDWNSMIRCHYHLRITPDDLHPQLQEILDGNISIGKFIYKLERADFIMTLMDCYKDIELSSNSIIAINIFSIIKRYLRQFQSLGFSRKSLTSSRIVKRHFLRLQDSTCSDLLRILRKAILIQNLYLWRQVR